MENTTEVPNDLIISAHKEASREIAERFENACPELFKPKFEKGKWYIHNDKDAIFCSNGNQIKSVGFGVDGNGKWTEDFWMYDYQVKDYRLATPSEVESHLKRVAEEKGYLKGVKIKSDYSKKEGVITGAFFMNGGDLCVDVEENKSILVFDNETGKWATIIPSELTLEERVAKLEKMIK